MKLLEDAPDFTLWHDPAYACLYATWHGYHASSLTRAQYELIRQHRQATHSTRLLNDSLLDEDGWSSVADWLADEYFDELAAEGLLAVAWVLPRQTEALYDTARVLARLKHPLVDTFTDAQAAYDWLHRWPTAAPAGSAPDVVPLTAARYQLLPSQQQLEVVQQHGRPLAPRWEADFYVKSYHLLDTLLVESYYHLHSGVFHQLRVQVLPAG